jgi:hypothetical protein
MNTLHPHEAKPPDPAAPIPAEIQSILDKAPRLIRRNFHLWRQAVAALDAAPNLRKEATARVWARRLGVSVSTVYGKRCEFRKRGIMVLLDKRHSADLWAGHRRGLPLLAVAYLKQLAAEKQLPAEAAIRSFTSQLKCWQNGDVSAKIPGYDRPPAGDMPPGWSPRNLARFLTPKPKLPGPGRLVFKCTFTIRRQDIGFVSSIHQTYPKTAALAGRRERPVA